MLSFSLSLPPLSYFVSLSLSLSLFLPPSLSILSPLALLIQGLLASEWRTTLGAYSLPQSPATSQNFWSKFWSVFSTRDCGCQWGVDHTPWHDKVVLFLSMFGRMFCPCFGECFVHVWENFWCLCFTFRESQSRGLTVFMFVINAPSFFEYFWCAGVDSVTTDYVLTLDQHNKNSLHEVNCNAPITVSQCPNVSLSSHSLAFVSAVPPQICTEGVGSSGWLVLLLNSLFLVLSLFVISCCITHPEKRRTPRNRTF